MSHPGPVERAAARAAAQHGHITSGSAALVACGRRRSASGGPGRLGTCRCRACTASSACGSPGTAGRWPLSWRPAPRRWRRTGPPPTCGAWRASVPGPHRGERAAAQPSPPAPGRHRSRDAGLRPGRARVRWGVPTVGPARLMLDLAGVGCDELVLLRALDEVRRLGLASWPTLWEAFLLHAHRGGRASGRAARCCCGAGAGGCPTPSSPACSDASSTTPALPEPVYEHAVEAGGGALQHRRRVSRRLDRHRARRQGPHDGGRVRGGPGAREPAQAERLDRPPVHVEPVRHGAGRGRRRGAGSAPPGPRPAARHPEPAFRKR